MSMSHQRRHGFPLSTVWWVCFGSQGARLLQLTDKLKSMKGEMERMWAKWQDMARLGLTSSLGDELLPEVRFRRTLSQYKKNTRPYGPIKRESVVPR